MDTAKETWINEVMDSLDGLKSAEPQPFLWTRIASKIQEGRSVPAGYMWLTAAAFAALLLVNILVIKPKQNAVTGPNGLAEQFQLDTPSTIDYN